MIEDKKLKKITFNLAIATDVLLGSIILTGNYRFEPKVIALTAACTVSNYAYIKAKRQKSSNAQ